MREILHLFVKQRELYLIMKLIFLDFPCLPDQPALLHVGWPVMVTALLAAEDDTLAPAAVVLS